jgi:MscS family membrane protein
MNVDDRMRKCAALERECPAGFRLGAKARLLLTVEWPVRARQGVRLLIVPLVSLLLSMSVTAAPAHSFEPIDTSSPRATFRSFLTLADDIGRLYSHYRKSPSQATQAALLKRFKKIDDLFDLSRVPPAERYEVASETFVLLLEVLARVDLPDFAAIPGDEQAAKLARWRIPKTEITIARVGKGLDGGEFLFSADTVAEIHENYELAREMPYLRPMPVTDMYQATRRLTGWMIPPTWTESLPPRANTLVFGQVLWKWLLMLLLLGLAAAPVIAIFTWGRRGPWDGSLHSYARRLCAPLSMVGLAFLVLYLGAFQLNVSGAAARGFILLIAVAKGIGAVWVVWVTMTWIAEAIISSPRVGPNSLGAHMIRLAARAAGALTIVGLVFHVANDLGVPLYGLVAGAGLGGLAVALAARSTLENFMGTLNLFADRPVKVGDFCRYGTDPSPGYLRIGTVEEIGLRSTRIRGIDRTVTTIPNAEFSNLQIVNLTRRERMLLLKTLRLRYETTPDQLRLVLAELHKMLLAHSRVTPDSARVRLTGFGESSIDVEIFAYVDTSDWGEFLAIQEDIVLRIMDIVAQAGTAMAFPSRTVYQARDGGLGRDRQQAAEQEVREWSAV